MTAVLPSSSSGQDTKRGQRPPAFVIALALVLAAVYAHPVAALVSFAWSSDLYSHVLLMPFVVGWFFWLRKSEFAPLRDRPAGLLAISGLLAASSLALAAAYYGTSGALQDKVAVGTLGLVLATQAVVIATLGSRVKRLAYPLALLFAMIPFPTALESLVEAGLQRSSADAAYQMFRIAGATVYREGMLFHLPGISLMVAPQCSGIHSSLVLLVTSLVGGYLFLSRPVHRVILALFVIPLGILRNGLRVFVLGQLCVHVDPDIIHSALHHRGGPIFFALSLIPFAALLWGLMRLEARNKRRASPGPGAPRAASEVAA